MRTSARATPLSDDLPCGPDLNASFDPAYEEYYFGAVGRLPGFYMQPAWSALMAVALLIACLIPRTSITGQRLAKLMRC